MFKKILIINPPAFSPKPYIEEEYIFMAPYVLASNLRCQHIDCQIYNFIEEKTELCGYENDRIERIAKCGNFTNELISKPVRYIGKHEKFYIEYLKAYKPNEVWISSFFTYNWQATKFVADLTREFNPLIKIKIGGIYPTLCYKHAKEKLRVSVLIMKMAIKGFCTCILGLCPGHL